MTQKISRQKGIAQFLVIAIMAFMALGIPTVTKLVEQNQENRSKAAEENTSTTVSPANTPTPRPIGNTNVSLFHNFAPKDYTIRKLGSVLVNDILIKTGNRKVDTATIVYCYTNLLKPDFNSISGEQIASVISNKEIGNNCAEVKVTFNDKELNESFPPYENLKGYIISYKVTVTNYGKGTLGIDCAKSSLINKDGQNILVNDPNCGYSNGTEFTIDDPTKVSPTPTRKPISETNQNGVCGDTTRIITNTCVSGSPVDLPDTLKAYIWECKGTSTTQKCVKTKGSDDWLCPENQNNQWGKCTDDYDIGWGCDRNGMCKSGKCDLTTSRCVAQTTSIKVSPTSLKMKVGQSQNLTYILTPSSSTDTVKWSTSNNSLVRIEKITLKCSDNTNTKCINAPGTNHLKVTALKPGTVKIKLTTTSGKSAEVTVAIANDTKITPPPKIPGAYLYFSPQNQNYKIGDVFKVTIGVDSDLNKIGGVDAIGNFDSSKLELLSINKSPSMVFGEKGECEISKDSPLGKFAFTCFDPDNSSSKEIKGELVYLTFKAKSAGTAKIEFLCKENVSTDSNIQSSSTFGDIIVCNKNINAKILILGSELTNGVCGSPKYDQLSPNSNTVNPNILCKSGKVEEFSQMAPNCSKTNTTSCPPSFYSWKCMGSNGGKSVKCSISSKIPTTKINIIPSSLTMKAGQIKNLTATITPDNLTDMISWSSSDFNVASVKIVNVKCPINVPTDGPLTKCISGLSGRKVQINGKKAGMVKIKARTSSGQTAEATVLVQK